VQQSGAGFEIHTVSIPHYSTTARPGQGKAGGCGHSMSVWRSADAALPED
jgi:hypothetical protein